MHPYVNCSIIYNNQDTRVTYMSTDRWKDKEVEYMYNSIFHKKEWHLAIWDNMDGPEGTMLSAVSQTQTDTLISLMSGSIGFNHIFQLVTLLDDTPLVFLKNWVKF